MVRSPGVEGWECVERGIALRIRSFAVSPSSRFHSTDVPPCSSRDIFATLIPRYRLSRRHRHGEGGGVAREPPHGLFFPRGVPLGLGSWPSPTGSQQTWTLYTSPSSARKGTLRRFISRKRLQLRRRRHKRQCPQPLIYPSPSSFYPFGATIHQSLRTHHRGQGRQSGRKRREFLGYAPSFTPKLSQQLRVSNMLIAGPRWRNRRPDRGKCGRRS